jgi:lipoprotein-releasing system permease protein
MLSFEYYIARREVQGRKQRKSLSGAIVNIVVFGIALCVAVMIIAISILTGFKMEIRNKVIGFGSHIQVLKMDSNYSFETQPISTKQIDSKELSMMPGIRHIQRFATKPGIIKSGFEFEGVVLKGVGPDYDWSFFQHSLIEGTILHLTDTGKTKDALISKYLANRLNLKVGDRFAMYFIQDPPRMRDLKVKGIYETNLQEFDKMFVLCDLKHVVKLNDWTSDQISGYELLINDFRQLDDITDEVYMNINYKEMKSDPLRVENIREKYPQIFDWLNLQDMNIMVFLIIMLLVTGFNMVSGLLILILESTSMIGLLKALGANNSSVRKIFLIESVFLTLKGLLWGNVIGWSVCLFQKYSHFIKLDAANYYISYVPININAVHILLLNAGIVIVIIAFLLLPSLIITKLDPVKSIRYN